MQYLYHKEAGTPQLELTGDEHRYLFKVRRHRAGETLYLRNLRDKTLYRYQIEEIDRKRASLLLQDQKVYEVEAKQRLHIGWCMIDPKSIEKVLPSLNEMGVAKVTFIYCKRSQKSFSLDFKRLEKILLNSSRQCGRSIMMELDKKGSLELFLKENPESWMLNFSEKRLGENSMIETLVIGAEGGFSEDECGCIAEDRVVGLDTPLILKSESAVCAAASKLLL
ncbi:MAG: 16S rRNA (uracil(1498)-N(3))-methyltransferase [Campylobacterota bacterium]|nr:16S rRNA (uracil(1498)-N(3))-methyltransferase [Campylobacterota bacterium]